MAWITISEDDVLTALCSPELEGYRAAALETGQADPVQPAISQVTDLVRGYVGGNPSNQLGAAGTIPQKLLAPALDIIAVRVPQRVGQAPAAVRKTAEENAIRLLEQVASGKFSIEEPVVKSAEKENTASPTWKARPSRFGHHAQDGI